MTSTIRIASGNRLNWIAAYNDITTLQTRATALEGGTAATGIANTFSIAAAAGAANVCNLTITAKDGSGATVAAVHQFTFVLSDSATTGAVTGTTASGTVTCSTGVDFYDLVAKKQKIINTATTGIAVIAITDTAKTTFYPVVFAGARGGKAIYGTQLITGNYG